MAQNRPRVREYYLFLKSEEGGIPVLTGLLTFLFLGILVFASEIARKTYVESQLLRAAEASAAQAAKSLGVVSEARARKIFFDIFPQGTQGAQITLKVERDLIGQGVRVTAEGDLKTIFGQSVGLETLPVKASAKVQRIVGSLEMAIVMNVARPLSGAQGYLSALKKGALSLVEKLYEIDELKNKLSVSVVPYGGAVNPGAQAYTFLKDISLLNNYPSDDPWQGCVAPVDLPLAVEEGEPADKKFNPYFAGSTIVNYGQYVKILKDMLKGLGNLGKGHPREVEIFPGFHQSFKIPKGQIGDNSWVTKNGNKQVLQDVPGINVGPNRSCVFPIVPLTQQHSALKSKINSLQPVTGGGSFSNLGLVWAWRTLSPHWASLWGEVTPKAYSAPEHGKFMVLLVDRPNMWFTSTGFYPSGDPTAFGRLEDEKLGDNLEEALATTQQLTQQVCGNIKEKGIELFVVNYRVSDEDTESLYKACASREENYYFVTSESQLETAVSDIVQNMQSVYVLRNS